MEKRPATKLKNEAVEKGEKMSRMAKKKAKRRAADAEKARVDTVME